MTALSGGHLAVDFASGSVPALIPFLTDRFDLNYAFAAMLLLASTVSSSLVQPLFGLWSDRRGALWLIPGGTILSAVGVGLAAVTPWYPLVLVLVFAGGLGVAAFPRGAKYAAYAVAASVRRHVVLQHRRQPGYALGAFVTGLLVAAIEPAAAAHDGPVAVAGAISSVHAGWRVAPAVGRGQPARTTGGRWRSVP
jgi:FSR family fosmidomycin resistance protein-like MFS transporter